MILTVKLTPKAKRNAITGWMEGPDGQKILKVSVTAVPEKGKANKALIELLAEHYKIPKSSISLLRGETERLKTLVIPDVCP
ncbi:MAG: DUF167 domain-containing protein [Alphaproteobacteria bacterium]|nr:DUF167 domain-containing protein [Alphaproteobacteria bacterium]